MEDQEDANVAAIRASQLLFRVLSQCSIRLGFASLNPSPLQLRDIHTSSKKAKSIPVLFSTWAATECANFLELFELERKGSDARHKLIQIGMKVRFREKILDDRLEERRIEVWQRRVRQSQRDLYKQVSGKSLAIRTRLALLRKKLRDKTVAIAPLHQEMQEIHNDIKNLQKSFVNASQVEFKLEAQLMRLVLVNRECEEKLAAEGAASSMSINNSNNNNQHSTSLVMTDNTDSASQQEQQQSPTVHLQQQQKQKHKSPGKKSRSRSRSPPNNTNSKKGHPTLRDLITVVESPLNYKSSSSVTTKTVNLVGPSQFSNSALKVDVDYNFQKQKMTFLRHNNNNNNNSNSTQQPKRGRSPPFHSTDQPPLDGRQLGLRNEMINNNNKVDKKVEKKK